MAARRQSTCRLDALNIFLPWQPKVCIGTPKSQSQSTVFFFWNGPSRGYLKEKIGLWVTLGDQNCCNLQSDNVNPRLRNHGLCSFSGGTPQIYNHNLILQWYLLN